MCRMAHPYLHVFFAFLLLLTLKTACGQDCAARNIIITQKECTTLQPGKCTAVTIRNIGRAPARAIYVNCGNFSPKVLIVENPGIFVKLEGSYCLVIEGGTLDPLKAVTFSYVSDVKYAMYTSSVMC